MKTAAEFVLNAAGYGFWPGGTGPERDLVQGLGCRVPKFRSMGITSGAAEANR